MIVLYVEDCRRRQLRPKTMLSYEQALKLFAAWLKESEGVLQVEQIEEKHISRYVLELQTRGKYTFCPMGAAMNYPQNRRDYKKPVSSITINIHQPTCTSSQRSTAARRPASSMASASITQCLS